MTPDIPDGAYRHEYDAERRQVTVRTYRRGAVAFSIRFLVPATDARPDQVDRIVQALAAGRYVQGWIPVARFFRENPVPRSARP